MKKVVLFAILLLSANSLFALNCDDIKSDPNAYFINMVANPKDDFEYLNSDFDCEHSLLN